MTLMDEVYGPDWNLLHWTTFDETRVWVHCADCQEQMLVCEIATVLRPEDIFPNQKFDNPAGLRAPLCDKCGREWLGIDPLEPYQ